MDHGKAWVIWEEPYSAASDRIAPRTLVSILPARRSERDVCDFMRQISLTACTRQRIGSALRSHQNPRRIRY
jgi:hypothetical protein